MRTKRKILESINSFPCNKPLMAFTKRFKTSNMVNTITEIAISKISTKESDSRKSL